MFITGLYVISTATAVFCVLIACLGESVMSMETSLTRSHPGPILEQNICLNRMFSEHLYEK